MLKNKIRYSGFRLALRVSLLINCKAFVRYFNEHYSLVIFYEILPENKPIKSIISAGSLFIILPYGISNKRTGREGTSIVGILKG